MARLTQVILLAGLAFCPATALGQAAIPESILGQLKAATVFVKVTTPAGPQTGSGFLIQKWETGGLIATNAHVISDDAGKSGVVTCIFSSGTRDEREITALVAGTDSNHDLAILSVTGRDLPNPIRIEKEVSIRETVPIYVLGFPFGESLATGGRNPSITISRGTVSSIRRDDYDQTALIQVDSGINPGNSGGPVVTETGVLAGISVAKVRSAEIGFAIPAAKLSAMLFGRVGSISFTRVRSTTADIRMDVEVTLINPRESPKEIRLLTIPKNKLESPTRPDSDGNWRAVSDTAKQTTLKIADGRAKVQESFRPEDDRIVCQLRIVRGDDVVVYTEPSEISLAAVGNSTKPVTPAASPHGIFNPGTDSDSITVHEFPGSITDIQVGGAGRYLLLHIPSDHTAKIFDLTTLTVVASVPAEEGALLAAGLDTFVVIDTLDNKLSRWSFKTLKKGRGATIPVNGVIKSVALGSASEGPLLVHWAVGTGSLDQAFYSLHNLRTLRGTQLNSRRGAVTPGAIRLNNVSFRDQVQIRASADGQVFGMWATSHSPSGLETLSVGRLPVVKYEHDSVGHVAPTASGLGVCTARGFFSTDLVRRRGEDICLPTTHAEYYFVLAQTGVVIRDVATGAHIWSLPGLDEFREADLRALRHTKLSFDKRFHCVPELDLFVTVPLTDNHLVIHRVPMLRTKTEVESEERPRSKPKTAREPEDDTHKKPEPYALRTWSDTTGKFRIAAQLVSVENFQVKLLKKDGSEITVPLKQLSDADMRYIKRVMAED